jgi:hypothetical protein
MRNLLAGMRHKTLFDTHIAHTRDAYLRFGGWIPDDGEGPFPVWRFLNRFAGNPRCRWRSTDRVTAISLHGANRHDMSALQRQGEIHAWLGRRGELSILKPDPQRSPALFHLFRLLLEDPPPEADDFQAYARRRGAYRDVLRDPLAPALFDLVAGRRIEHSAAAALITALARPAFVGYMHGSLAGRLAAAIGREPALAVARRVLAGGRAHRAGVCATIAMLHLQAGNRREALDALESAIAAGPDIARQFAGERDRLAAEIAQADVAPDHTA